MEKIKITFLGTGNAIPTKKRNHTSILLTYKNENILIDCGEGTQRQFRIAGISPSKITQILLTHWHGDHILGLPGLFQTLTMNNFSSELKVYGPKKTKEFISQLTSLLNLKIKLSVSEPPEKILLREDYEIIFLPMSHGIPSLAYSFIIKEKLRLNKQKIKKLKLPNSPLLGKLARGEDIVFKGKKIKSAQLTYKEKSRKVTLILDTLFNENAITLAKNSDLLICEASFSKKESQLAKEYLHLTSEQAATIAKKSSSKKLILTHISQRYEHSPEIILKEAKKIFKNTSIANDFDVFEI